jgi:tripartite-type tricarboxylate transporter receptor subunit TctC
MITVARGFMLPVGGLLLLAIAAAAQAYPVKTIRMVVAYPPSGGTDMVGRLVAQRLGENVEQTVVTRLRKIVRILGDADTKDWLLAQGFEPVGSTPDEFGAYIKAEIAKWGRVIKAAGINAD